MAEKLILAHPVYGSFLFVGGGCLAVSQCHCHTDERGLAVIALWKGVLILNVLIGYIHRGLALTQTDYSAC